MILALRTDKPEAELYVFDQLKQVDQLAWHAHRELSDTLLLKIEEILNRNKLDKKDLKGLVVYEGPGSFTGLRIGISVMNALSYSLNIPISGGTGDSWREDAINKLTQPNDIKIVLPHYGSEPHITKPRK